MRFALSDDQAAFRDAVRELLAKECPPAVVRAAWDAAPGELDRGVWDSLAAMGVLDLLVPEADGGLGLGETFLVPILEECGRAALPHPIVETAMVAAPLLGAGAGMVSTDLGGPLIPCALDADVLLVRRGDGLVTLPSEAVDLEPEATVDGARRAARIGERLDTSQPATPSAASGPSPSSAHEADLDLAFDRGALGTAAVLVGIGQAMLDMTVGYVRERHDMILYPEFAAKGWQIGSGPTEASCKTLTARLKGSGMRWDPSNAEAIMALEALSQSSLWKEYWQTLLPTAA